MLTAAIIMALVIIALLLYAISCNGKGPDAGCCGVIAIFVAVILFIIELVLLAFWAGMRIE